MPILKKSAYSCVFIAGIFKIDMKLQDFSVLLRAVLFGTIFMIIGLLSGLIAAHFVTQILPNMGGKVAVGLSLFVIWLVHGSTLRSIVRLDKNIGFPWIVLAGILTIMGGVGLTHFLRQVIENTAMIEFPILSTADFGQKALVLTVTAVFLSLFSAINLKVKSRFFGNFLELILIIATCFLIYSFLK